MVMLSTLVVSAESWKLETQKDWEDSLLAQDGVEVKNGKVTPLAESATFTTGVQRYQQKKKAGALTLTQSPEWLNWQEIPKVAPSNLFDAPVCLTLGPGNYWVFGRYSAPKGKAEAGKPVELEGFDVPLTSTADPRQFNAESGTTRSLGGYHAWQSKDMENWVHFGPITETFSRWMTTAEYVDGKAYFYFDFPNDQDPHLYIDENLFDGKPGKNMGMVFHDPSHGSDCGVIRTLDGQFHMISEDWTPINASARSWDSPLGSHAVSPDGIQPFELRKPAVDYRTKPTGEIKTYQHPHWKSEDPANYKTNTAEYEVHLPVQDAYGDWAAIAIGEQYYLFSDYDEANEHGRHNMSVAWLTSSSIDEQFEYCGKIGHGHPDPDVTFANGQFYLVTQLNKDYVSTGPWVESVEARLGVDTDNDGDIDQWTDWQNVSERYDYTPGFSKVVKREAATLDASALPAGYGFQYEVKLRDTTENISKPIIQSAELSFVE